MFEQSDLDVLKQYEQQFTTAIKANYARGVLCRDLEAFNKIWETRTGHKLQLNCGCSSCCLNFLKTVGKQYFKDKQALEGKFVEVLDEIFDDIDDEPKKGSKSTGKTNKKPNKKTNKK